MSVNILKAEQLNLPHHLAEKLKGRKIELVETVDGILIKPVEDPIKELRGFLDGGKFKVEDYLKQKQQDKGLENE